MRKILFVLLILGIPFPICAGQPLVVSRNSIPTEEQEQITGQLRQIKNTTVQNSSRDQDDVLHGYISRLKDSDLETFFKRIVMNNGRIERIALTDSVLTIRFEPEFYWFRMMDAVYGYYSDMYEAFFSYPEIAGVSIVLTNGTNLTFLPTIGSDCWLAIKGGIMIKEWHITGIDYVEVLGIRRIEAGDFGFPEYEADKIGAKIKQYRDSVGTYDALRYAIVQTVKAYLDRNEDTLNALAMKARGIYHR